MTSLDVLKLNSVTEATPSEVDAVRRPDQIYTEGYLNSPIRYKTDPRFIPSLVTKELNSLPDSLKRDFVSAVQININTEDRQGFVINTYSPTWSREKYNRVMGTRVNFSFF
jgi:hypothetical protein